MKKIKKILTVAVVLTMLMSSMLVANASGLYSRPTQTKVVKVNQTYSLRMTTTSGKTLYSDYNYRGCYKYKIVITNNSASVEQVNIVPTNNLVGGQNNLEGITTITVPAKGSKTITLNKRASSSYYFSLTGPADISVKITGMQGVGIL